jgi:hypothetical protein
MIHGTNFPAINACYAWLMFYAGRSINIRLHIPDGGYTSEGGSTFQDYYAFGGKTSQPHTVAGVPMAWNMSK